LYISVKSCIFAVEKERDINLLQTTKQQKAMITLKNINKNGLAYIAMAIDDIVRGEYEESNKGQGMNLKNCWLTPETCYWLRKLLDEAPSFITSQLTKKRLEKGTNVGLE
jgi:hypothetical protein